MKSIPLSKYGKNRGKYFARIDDDDYDRIGKFNWSVFKHVGGVNYAVRSTPRNKNGKQKIIFMHRELLGLNRGNKKLVDHINHDGLNNQKNNLRICTIGENSRNRRSQKKSSSKFLGVGIRRIRQNNRVYSYWQAGIRINGIKTNLGSFKKENEAAIAYNKSAIKNHGIFANINKIPK